MKLSLLFGLASAIFATGCAALPRHEHVVGDVRSVNAKNAVVCMEGKSVHTGQRLAVSESSCKRSSLQKRWAKVPIIECVEKKVADAEVQAAGNLHEVNLRLLSQHDVKAGDYIGQ